MVRFNNSPIVDPESALDDLRHCYYDSDINESQDGDPNPAFHLSTDVPDLIYRKSSFPIASHTWVIPFTACYKRLVSGHTQRSHRNNSFSYEVWQLEQKTQTAWFASAIGQDATVLFSPPLGSIAES